MTRYDPTALSKVPAITFGFWIAKIFATTLGETAGRHGINVLARRNHAGRGQ